MKQNYIKNHSIWDAPVSLMDSRTWKLMTDMRNTALMIHMHKTIGSAQQKIPYGMTLGSMDKDLLICLVYITLHQHLTGL